MGPAALLLFLCVNNVSLNVSSLFIVIRTNRLLLLLWLLSAGLRSGGFALWKVAGEGEGGTPGRHTAEEPLSKAPNAHKCWCKGLFHRLWEAPPLTGIMRLGGPRKLGPLSADPLADSLPPPFTKHRHPTLQSCCCTSTSPPLPSPPSRRLSLSSFLSIRGLI